jgi:hypothetical protein
MNKKMIILKIDIVKSPQGRFYLSDIVQFLKTV